MKKLCCVDGCSDTSKQKKLYGLPVDYKLKHCWLGNIRDKIYSPNICHNNNELKICNLHFKPEDFLFHFNTDGTICKQLNQDAIPSIFPNSEEWNNNCVAHMQLEEAHQISADVTRTQTTFLPDEDAVQLGNVESLGIIAHEATEANNSTSKLDEESVIPTSPTPNKQKSVFNSPRSVNCNTQKSPSVPSRLQYSCTDCNFKSTDAIVLKDHRVKNHAPGNSSSSDEVSVASPCKRVCFTNKNSNIVKNLVVCRDVKTFLLNEKEVNAHPDSMCTQSLAGHTEFQQNLSEKDKSQANAILSKPDLGKSSENDIEHLCSECAFKSFQLCELIEHQKIHDNDGSSTEELTEEESEPKVNDLNCSSENQLDVSNEGPDATTKDSQCSSSELQVFRCPDCSYRGRTVLDVHSHVAVCHNKSAFFKCSHCDFTSYNRRNISKHILKKKKIHQSHDNANWVKIPIQQELSNAQHSMPYTTPFALPPVKENSSENATNNSESADSKDEVLDVSCSGKKTEKCCPGPSSSSSVKELSVGLPRDQLVKQSKGVPTLLKLDETIIVSQEEQTYHSEECDLSVHENTPLHELLKKIRKCKGTILKLSNATRITRDKLKEYMETQLRNASDEKNLLERKEMIHQRSSALTTERIQTEMQIRMQQCETLRHRLTLLKADGNDKQVSIAEAALLDSEKKGKQLEERSKNIQQEVDGLDKELHTCIQQLKDVAESSASIAQLINILHKEIYSSEAELRTCQKKRGALLNILQRNVSKARSRVRISTAVQMAKAACAYKKALLSIREKEQLRLKYLDQLLQSDIDSESS